MIKKITLLFILFIGIANAQITTYNAPNGGNIQSIVANDSVMVCTPSFQQSNWYVKNVTDTAWQTRTMPWGNNNYPWFSCKLRGNSIYTLQNIATGNVVLYKSNDLCNTWQTVISAPILENFLNSINYYSINDFYVDSTSILFATYVGLYKYDLATQTFTNTGVSNQNIVGVKMIEGNIYCNTDSTIFISSNATSWNTYYHNPNGLIWKFSIEGIKAAYTNGYYNYFSADAGNTLVIDNYSLNNNNIINFNVAVKNGVFYSMYGIADITYYGSSKAIIRHAISPNNFATDSLMVHNSEPYNTNISCPISLSSPTFANGELFFCNAFGVLNYNQNTSTFHKENIGIKEDKVCSISLNTNYHIVQTNTGAYLKNIATGHYSDLNLPNNNLYQYYYSKPELTISSNNKIYCRNEYNDTLHVTSDFGTTWQFIADSVKAFSVQSDSLVAVSNSQIIISTNGGATTTIVQSPLPVDNYSHYYVVASNSNIVVGGVTSASIYVDFLSNNFGISWVFNVLPNDSIINNSVSREYKFNGNDLYVMIYCSSCGSFNLNYFIYKKQINNIIWTNLNIGQTVNSVNYFFITPQSLSFWFSNNKLYVLPYLDGNFYDVNPYEIIIYASLNDGATFYPEFTSNPLNFPLITPLVFYHNGNLSVNTGNLNYYTFVDNTIGYVTGKVLYDVNANNIADAADTPINGAVISNTNNYSFTNSFGNYTIALTQINETLLFNNPP